MFIDPTGNHILIVSVSGDLYYLHSSKSKVVALKRFSGYTIESVAWNRQEGNEQSTGVDVVVCCDSRAFSWEPVTGRSSRVRWTRKRST